MRVRTVRPRATLRGLVLFFCASLGLPGTSRADPCAPSPCFRRGDSDGNGFIDVGDATRTLGFLFLGRAAPVCLDAADLDRNGAVTLSDVVQTLSYLFQQGLVPNGDTPPCECDCNPGLATECGYPAQPCDEQPTRPVEPDLSFEILGPAAIEGSPLTSVPFEVQVVLRNRAPDRLVVDGWTFGLATVDDARCAIVAGELAGTDAGALLNAGFEKTELTLGPGNLGLVSAVVLHLTETAALPPTEGPHSLLRVGLTANLPGESCAPCEVQLRPDRVGSGLSVPLRVSASSSGYQPLSRPQEVLLCTALPTLAGGVPNGLSLTRSTPAAVWRIDPQPPRGTVVGVTLATSDPADRFALLARRGAPPARAKHDAEGTLRPDGTLGLVLTSRGEPLYVEVVAIEVSGEAAEASLLVTQNRVHLGGISTSCPGGCRGELHALVSGGGFTPDLEVFLEGPEGVRIDALGVLPLSSEQLDASFQLDQAPPGAYALVARLGDATSRLAGAIQVSAVAPEATLAVKTPGSTRYRPGRVRRFDLRTENTGNVEVPVPTFLISGPPGVELWLEDEDTAPCEGSPRGGPALLCLGVQASGSAGFLSPGGVSELAVFFRHPDPGERLELAVRRIDPLSVDPVDWRSLAAPACLDPERWLAALPRLEAEAGNSWGALAMRLAGAARRLGLRGIPHAGGRALFAQVFREATALRPDAVTGVVQLPDGTPVPDHRVAALDPVTGDPRACSRTDAAGRFNLAPLAPGAYDLVVEHFDRAPQRVELAGGKDLLGLTLEVLEPGTRRVSCENVPADPLPGDPPLPPPGALVEANRLELVVVRAIDPNEKEGPVEDLIRRGQPLEFTVHFENLPTAQAAAERVTVVDRLDPAFDLSSLVFRNVTVGKHTVALDGPRGSVSGIAPWSGPRPRLAAGASSSVLVPFPDEDQPITVAFSVSASLDVSSRTLTWVLEGADPVTMLSLRNPDDEILVGFLPPNRDGTSGAGEVTYTIEVAGNSASGSEVKNRADITFDSEVTFSTNETRHVLAPCDPVPFVRGDANGDGTVDISDAIHVIGYLFLGASATACRESSNTNGDQALDISDPVFLLNRLFGAGPALPSPSSCSEPPQGAQLTFDCCAFAGCG